MLAKFALLVNFLLPTSYLILLIPLAFLYQLYHLFNFLVNPSTCELVNCALALLNIHMATDTKMRFILRIEVKRAAHGSAIIEPQFN